MVQISRENSEALLATAVKYLIKTGHHQAARLLSTCELQIIIETDYDSPLPIPDYCVLYGPEEFVLYWSESEYIAEYSRTDYPNQWPIYGAFKALIPSMSDIIQVVLRPEPVDENWRSKVTSELSSAEVNNQNPYLNEQVVWKGMKFNAKSPGELAIAKALEDIGVMYMPTPLLRVGAIRDRRTFFPDFLICVDGKWGILEVDGRTYHTGTATDDHQRTREIVKHSHVYVDRFPSTRCIEDPSGIVAEFLDMLKRQ